MNALLFFLVIVPCFSNVFCMRRQCVKPYMKFIIQQRTKIKACNLRKPLLIATYRFKGLM